METDGMMEVCDLEGSLEQTGANAPEIASATPPVF
jgi:hypothetical protein